MQNTISILSVPITRKTKENVLEEVFQIVRKKEKRAYIVTPNPELIVIAQKNKEFLKALVEADLSMADGVGVTLAARILGLGHISRIPGVDFLEDVCKEAAKQSQEGSKNTVSIGFLGGRDGVAEKTAECLSKKYPGLNVVFVAEEWEDDQQAKSKWQRANDTDEENMKEPTNQTPHAMGHIDILFVAFGSPKQEIWMSKNRGKIPVTLMMGVGGAFDFLSGKVPRAPKGIRDFGLEWLFRLVIQPWRIKRQLALIYFLYLVFKQRFSQGKLSS